VTPGGLVVPLQFTHEALGRLIGARRPTVSLALKELSSAGLLSRRDDGAWLLRPDAFAEVTRGSLSSSTWQRTDARRIVEATVGRMEAPPVPDAGPLRQVTPDMVAQLSARVERLRSEHPARVNRTTGVLERCRARRRERRLGGAGESERDAA
jgi:hypothetical protein